MIDQSMIQSPAALSDPRNIMLAHQYLYYVVNKEVLSDFHYDKFCKTHGLDGNGGSDLASDYSPEIVSLAEYLAVHPEHASGIQGQTMMLGVPAGTEPVSERSLADKPPVETKPKRKREIRGVIKTNIDGEEYRVEMR